MSYFVEYTHPESQQWQTYRYSDFAQALEHFLRVLNRGTVVASEHLSHKVPVADITLRFSA